MKRYYGSYRHFYLGLSLIASMMLAGCSSFSPQDLHYGAVKTDAMPFELEYGVYTPPGWTKQESLPMILFLHGSGDDHTAFEKFGAHRYFDEQIAGGNMPRVILVSPNGGFGLWENWADGSHLYRDWITETLLPEVKQRYNVKSCPLYCHLMGISMGGSGVLRMAYFESRNFSSISAISAPIFGNEDNRTPTIPWLVKLTLPIERIFGKSGTEERIRQNPYNAWVDNPGLRNMRLQLIWGDNDRSGIISSNQRFHEYLARKQVEHNHHVYSGNHKWVSWIPTFNKVVNFLVNDNGI